MEDVLKNSPKVIRGFIDLEGVLIKVTNVEFYDSNPVEIVAASICESVLKYEKTKEQIQSELKQRGMNVAENSLFQSYLIEACHYLYVHLCYEEQGVSIVEIKKSHDSYDALEIQKEKLRHLCKNAPINAQKLKILQFMKKS